MTTINDTGEALYQSLIDALAKCADQPCPIRQTEQRFAVCQHHCRMLLRQLDNYTFQHVEEEIHFFRSIRPRFTAESEYYRLYYHVQLFTAGLSDPLQLRDFRHREAQRLDKFIGEHQRFYDYVTSGRTDCDALYFTRINTPAGTGTLAGACAGYRSLYGPLVATLLALQRYDHFVRNQLAGEG